MGISKKEILTAAHCTVGDNAGDIYVGNEEKVKVCGKREHESYSTKTLDNDFAVLTLCEELTFSEKVQPVCLPSTEGQGSMYESGPAIVSGWGTLYSSGPRPENLQEVTVNMMTNGQCTSDPYDYSSNDITDNMICAAEPGKDSCQGDSGGPLVMENGGKFTQVGVVSWGYGCADAKYPGVYARVTKQLNWIKNGVSGTCSA